MHHFSVAGGILYANDLDAAGDAGILLVCNRRRDGRIDWTPPGGIVDAGETQIEALSREVREETSLVVDSWGPMLYEVNVEFVDRDFTLHATIFEAVLWTGAVHVDDPDGVVIDAAFASGAAIEKCLRISPRWVSEPVVDWMSERWNDQRSYSFRAQQTEGGLQVERR